MAKTKNMRSKIMENVASKKLAKIPQAPKTAPKQKITSMQDLRKVKAVMTANEFEKKFADALAALDPKDLITSEDKYAEVERRRLEENDRKWRIKETANGSK